MNVLMFLNSEKWNKIFAKEEMTRDPINEYIYQVNSGYIMAREVFINNYPGDLSDKFHINPEFSFLEIALSECEKKNPMAVLFIETTIRRYPSLFHDFSKKINNLMPQIQICFIEIVINVFFIYDYQWLKSYILEFNQEVVVLSLLATFDSMIHDYKSTIFDLFNSILVKKGDLLFLHPFIKAYIDSDVIGSILDFCESNVMNGKINYETMFTELFVPVCSPHFVELLTKRFDPNIQEYTRIQSRLIPEPLSQPLKSLFGKYDYVLTNDNEIISVAESFKTTGVFPKLLSDIQTKNKNYYEESLLPSIQRLSNSNEAVLFLCEYIVGKERPKMKIEPIDLREMDAYSRTKELSQQFLKSVYMKGSNLPNLVQAFYNEVISIYSQQSKKMMAKVSINVICEENGINIFSWTMFSLLLPIEDYLSKVFELNKEVELRILIAFHNSYLRGFNTQNSNSCFDTRLVLRLRWRYLRNDTMQNISQNPLFSTMIVSDEITFLKWELSSNDIIDYSEILTKLGIVPSHSIIDELITNQNTNIPLYEAILKSGSLSFDSIHISENPNYDFIFRTQLIWDRRIMQKPFIKTILRTPTIELTNFLIKSLPQNHIPLLTQFPHAFSSIMVHYDHINTCDIPLYIKEAYDIMNNRLKNSTPRKNVAYAIINAILIKEMPLLEFLDTHNEQEWLIPSVTLSICIHKFDLAAKIISNWPLSMFGISKSIPYEDIFFERGTWASSLKMFIVFCASNRIVFSEIDQWTSIVSTNISDSLTQDFDAIRNYLIQIRSPNSNSHPRQVLVYR